MDWFDAHSGSVQAFATLVLVILTAYYAWASRALVRETHATLQATARMTLQSRLDRVSELMISQPGLFEALDAPDATGEERDARFHLANIIVATFEEAYAQHYFDSAMSDEDWRAWVATMDGLMSRRYLALYWQHVRGTFGESFKNFLDERLNSPAVPRYNRFRARGP